MKRLFLLLVLPLTGCCLFRGPVIPPAPPVKVPVFVPCLAGVPTPPTYRFELLPPPQNEAEAADQVRVLWKDRELAISYATKWEAAAAGCERVDEKTPL